MHWRTGGRATLVAAAALLLAVGLAACGGNSGGGGGAGGGKIALLLPETNTARYEAQDRPLFQKKVKELCSSCEIIYSNADQDAAKQQRQAEAAIASGAKVLVLDPVDSASAAAMVTRAKQAKIPVISYDRLITAADVDYYISFDSVQVGRLQATSLIGQLEKTGKGRGTILMINGAPPDHNAKLLKRGAHSVLDSSGVKIGKEYDTPDWSPHKARAEAQQAITALGKDGFDGVYAANDATAGGAIAAMKRAGIDPSTKPTTGEDAELAGIRRIVAGDQFMTVYKAYKTEAEDAATIAVALAQGKSVPAGLVNQKVDNRQKSVDSIILKPVTVTKANVMDTVVKDGLYSVADICTGAYQAACAKAGIK
ncbi:MAG: D-xylose transport system substrate-binding protein [Thermoleophilaceae bacterium]|nr:D-xylose transport system substrate-binding protein [Thermoleophilaceae bacterium]